MNLRSYLHVFRRNWWLAVLAVVATVGSTIALTLYQTKIYQGDARLFVGARSISRQDISQAQNLTQTSLALVKSYSEAIKSRPIAENVVKTLSLRDDPQKLLKRLTTAPVLDTQIIRVSFADADSRKAASVANAFANSFIASLAKIDPTEAGGAAVTVSVLEPAVATASPVSPEPVRNVAIGVFVGVLLAWGVVLLAERLDASIKGRLDAEEAGGLPVLGLVPHVKLRRGELLVAAPTAAGEAFRALRTGVQYLWSEGKLTTLLVTSAEVEDGKTTSAFNLAVAFAEGGIDTVFVEADMRRPTIAHALGMAVPRGLSNVLAEQKPEQPVFETSFPHLFFVGAGVVPDNPAELLAGPRMKELLDELAQWAGIVIVDSPPVLAVADPVSLAPIVDGVLVVVRSAKTKRDHLVETVRVLRGVGASLIGLVVNDIRKVEAYGSGYGYGYGYGAYSSRSRAPHNGGPVDDEDKDISALRAQRRGIRT